MPLAPIATSIKPPIRPAIHIALAPKMAPAEAMAPVSVADGPRMAGSRLPQVAFAKVASPMQTRQAEIIVAACSAE